MLRKEKLEALEEELLHYKRKDARTQRIEEEYVEEIVDLKKQLKEAKEALAKYEPIPKVSEALGLSAVVQDSDVDIDEIEAACAELFEDDAQASPIVQPAAVATLTSPAKPFADRTNDYLMLFGTKEKFML